MIVALAWIGTSASAEPAVPALTGPVVDAAGVLSAPERQRLEQLAFAARQERGGNGVQLQYLLVPSLEGEPIESFSIRVAEKWKLGSAQEDNGLLFVVSRDDRRMRIEVGGGIEGGLTDAQAGRIIRDTLAPAFRAGQYGEGLYRGGIEALAAVGGLPEGVAALAPRTAARRPTGSTGACGPGMLVMFGLLMLLGRIFGGPGRRRRGIWWAPILIGGLGGGSHRGGGRGGGGWGGGGGGFSGGGASGSW